MMANEVGFTPSSVAGFNSDLQKWKKKVLPEQFDIAIRKFALDILTGIVMNTRVDTGRARGNWQTSIDRPILSERERLDPDGNSTIREGLSRLRSVPGGYIGHSIYITNNVPYILELEDLDHMVSDTFANQRLAFR